MSNKNKSLERFRTIFLQVNRAMMMSLGIQEAVILQHFVDLSNNIFKRGSFFQQQDRIAAEFPISAKTAGRIIDFLVEKGFIKKFMSKRMNYYKVNHEVIEEYLKNLILEDQFKFNKKDSSVLSAEEEMECEVFLVKKGKKVEYLKFDQITKKLNNGEIELADTGNYYVYVKK